MRQQSFIATILVYLLMTSFVYGQNNSIILDNGVIRREINYSNNQVSSHSISLLTGNKQYIKEKAAEFAILINDKHYSGLSKWHNIQYRDTSDQTGGKGVIISFESHTGQDIAIELHYLLYPELPVIHKALKVMNTGNNDMKLEGVDVESSTTRRLGSK